MTIARSHSPVGLHLIAGWLATGAVILPLVMVWYPRPLFEAAGTARLPVALAALAAVAGPLAAFVYARRGRPLRGRRLGMVFLAQLLALAGCALALYVQRPVYLVFTVDRFDLVLARDLAPQDLAKAPPAFARRPIGPPEYAAAVPPADPGEAQRILNIALGGGKDLQAYPQHYVPYPQLAAAALRRAKPLATILERDDGQVRRYVDSIGRSADSLRWLPLRGRKKDGVVLLDAVSGLPVGVVLVDPWAS